MSFRGGRTNGQGLGRRRTPLGAVALLIDSPVPLAPLVPPVLPLGSVVGGAGANVRAGTAGGPAPNGGDGCDACAADCGWDAEGCGADGGGSTGGPILLCSLGPNDVTFLWSPLADSGRERWRINLRLRALANVEVLASLARGFLPLPCTTEAAGAGAGAGSGSSRGGGSVDGNGILAVGRWRDRAAGTGVEGIESWMGVWSCGVLVPLIGGV